MRSSNDLVIRSGVLDAACHAFTKEAMFKRVAQAYKARLLARFGRQWWNTNLIQNRQGSATFSAVANAGLLPVA